MRRLRSTTLAPEGRQRHGETAEVSPFQGLAFHRVVFPGLEPWAIPLRPFGTELPRLRAGERNILVPSDSLPNTYDSLGAVIPDQTGFDFVGRSGTIRA
jgi:hypothetical protein